MSLNVYDASAGLFIRGLTNLKSQLTKAEAYAASSGRGEAALLDARLSAVDPVRGVANVAPGDLHMYTLAAQVHWTAQSAKLAIGHLLGAPQMPPANDAKSFADLQHRLAATIAYLREIEPSELDGSVERAIVVERPRGALHFTGGQFLLEFALPHYFYHLTTAYGILRNEGVQLTMGDFLGSWGRV